MQRQLGMGGAAGRNPPLLCFNLGEVTRLEEEEQEEEQEEEELEEEEEEQEQES